MNQLTIFLIGLSFLIFFSYRDLKYSRIENKLIMGYLIVTLGVLILTGNINIRDCDTNQYTDQYKEITKELTIFL